MINEEEVKVKKNVLTVEPTEDLLKFPLDDSTPDQKIQVGSMLDPTQ